MSIRALCLSAHREWSLKQPSNVTDSLTEPEKDVVDDGRTAAHETKILIKVELSSAFLEQSKTLE